MESSLLSITYSILECWIVVTNTKEIKRKERERREKKRKSYLRGFLFCAVMA
jgi:hypothetical protein